MRRHPLLCIGSLCEAPLTKADGKRIWGDTLAVRKLCKQLHDFNRCIASHCLLLRPALR